MAEPAPFVTKSDPWAEKIIAILRAAGNEFTLSVVTFGLVGTTCYLCIVGKDVPTIMITLVTAVIQFWYKNYREERAQRQNSAPVPSPP